MHALYMYTLTTTDVLEQLKTACMPQSGSKRSVSVAPFVKSGRFSAESRGADAMSRLSLDDRSV